MVLYGPAYAFAYFFLVTSLLGLIIEPNGWVLWVPLAIISTLLLRHWQRWPFNRR